MFRLKVLFPSTPVIFNGICLCYKHIHGYNKNDNRVLVFLLVLVFAFVLELELEFQKYFFLSVDRCASLLIRSNHDTVGCGRWCLVRCVVLDMVG